VGAGVEVPAHAQLVLCVQDGFRQKPPEQTRLDEQLALLPQVPLHELGVAVGVDVGVSVGVSVGVDVGVSEGDAVEPIVNVSLQLFVLISAA